MLNSIVMFCFIAEILILGKFGPKNLNCLFKMKTGTGSNLSMLNMIVIFTFSDLDRKHLFWANLVQKFKIVCLR